MIVYIRTNDTRGLKIAVDEERKFLLPKGCPPDFGFYLTEPKLLYFDNGIDNDTIGQLDKALCSFTNDHIVLQKWQELQACKPYQRKKK